MTLRLDEFDHWAMEINGWMLVQVADATRCYLTPSGNMMVLTIQEGKIIYIGEYGKPPISVR
uniref:Uncharacterized protein n=1 Tax=viral metagenome TaxID=1070528 RepID=A0A6M3J232_9ZZZZ